MIPGRTQTEAREKYEDYLRYSNLEGVATLYSRWSGIDLSRYELSDPITHVDTNHMQSAVERYTTADPGKVWTVGDIIRHMAVGGGEKVIGSPSQVADELQSWIEEADIDGFNLGYALAHESFKDFVDLVVPELQRRGAYKTAYAPGTLREKLFGRKRLPQTHPGAHVRPGQAHSR